MPRITNLHQNKWFVALVVLACLFLVWKGDRRVRIWVLCAALAVGISDPLAARVVKKLIPRERPCRDASLAGTVRLAPGTSCPGSNSFPSNHASNMMALAGVCWWFSRRRPGQRPGEPSSRRSYAYLWFLLPLVIGYSRIYLGFHYPSDVLGGWLLGAAVAAVVIWLVARRLLPAGDRMEERPEEAQIPPAP